MGCAIGVWRGAVRQCDVVADEAAADVRVGGGSAVPTPEILRNYKEYSRKGYCPNYAKEAENRAYKAYHALGGNDIATDKHDHIMSLPDEQEKKE